MIEAPLLELVGSFNELTHKGKLTLFRKKDVICVNKYVDDYEYWHEDSILFRGDILNIDLSDGSEIFICYDYEKLKKELNND